MLDDPALLSLLVLTVYGAAAVGWRVARQVRRTGDTGIRFRPSSRSEWIAGVTILVGLALSVLAPIAHLAQVVAIFAYLETSSLQVLGLLMAIAGIALTLRSQLDMGASWRIGVHVGEAAPLVTRGIFAVVRNPIFSCVLLTFAGLFLLVPNVLGLTGWIVLACALEFQVRCVEEPHLERVHGPTYRGLRHAYGALRSGPRALPGVGRPRSVEPR